MKTASLSLCAGMMLAAIPCRAQQPAAEVPAPLLLMYVVKYGESALPRVALGLEKPTLRIAAFAKCVRVSTANPDLMGLAAQLNAEDSITLVDAIKALGAPDARELPNVIIWFATPDNKALDYISTGVVSGIEDNLIKGIFMFDTDKKPTLTYLNEKLHPE